MCFIPLDVVETLTWNEQRALGSGSRTAQNDGDPAAQIAKIVPLFGKVRCAVKKKYAELTGKLPALATA
jgi:hypothetical protein